MKFKRSTALLLFFLLALVFCSSVVFLSLRKSTLHAITSEVRVSVQGIHAAVSRGLYYGKTLQTFHNMDLVLEISGSQTNHLLKKYAGLNIKDGDIELAIFDHQHQLLFGDQLNLDFDFLHDIPVEKMEFSQDGKQFLYIPFFNEKEDFVGTFCVAFPLDSMRDLFIYFLKMCLIVNLIFATLGIVFISQSISKNQAETISSYQKRNIIIGVALLLLVATLLQNKFAGNIYIKTIQSKAIMTAAIVNKDLSVALKRGVPLNKIKQADRLLKRMLPSAGVIESVSLLTPKHETVVSVYSDAEPAPAYTKVMGLMNVELSDADFRITRDIKTGQKSVGTVEILLSPKKLYAVLFSTLMDSLTVVLVAVMFFFEFLFCWLLFQEFKYGIEKGHSLTRSFLSTRMAAFLFVFSANMALPFLALYIRELSLPPMLSTFPDEFLTALPLTVEMAAVGIAQLIMGKVIDQRGFKQVLLGAVVLCSVANFLSLISQSTVLFLFSRMLNGFSFGTFVIGAMAWTVSFAGAKHRGEAISSTWAGAFSGLICGSTVAGIMSEYLGVVTIFACSGVLSIVTLLYLIPVFRFFRGKISSNGTSSSKQGTLRAFITLLRSRDFVAIVFLGFVPGAVAYIGFTNYLCPVYLDEQGASLSSIGRLLIVHGIAMTYLSPLFNKWIDSCRSQKKFIWIASSLSMLAFIGFGVSGDGLYGVVFAVILISLSESLNISRVYMLKLKVVQEVGDAMAISVFNTLGRFGFAAAPLIFGYVRMTDSLKQSSLIIGGIYLICICCFMLIVRSEKQLYRNNLLRKDENYA